MIWDAARKASSAPDRANRRALAAAIRPTRRRARASRSPSSKFEARAAGSQISQRKAGAATSSERAMKWTDLRNGYITADLAHALALGLRCFWEYTKPKFALRRMGVDGKHPPAHGVLAGAQRFEGHRDLGGLRSEERGVGKE